MAATIVPRRSLKVVPRGRQRLQALKPARSASSQVAKNCTFSGSARRELHEGRQYTPVVRTAK